MVISLVVLLGCAALVVDLGLGWWSKRELQAHVDAAALAGAQELPSASAAVSRAQEYLARNPVKGAKSLHTSVTTACNTSVPGCNPVNSVQISAEGEAATGFARIFGLDSMHIKAKATACSPCGTKPLDIMIVLDRTGSMNEGSPTKMTHAKNGVRTFLQFLDPNSAHVALTVVPPASSVGNRCATVSTSNWATYDQANPAWVVVPFSSDYKIKGGGLNPASDLVATLNCQNPGGYTHYTIAIDEAQKYLTANGRPDVQDVIIFLTDGEANSAPHTGIYSSSSHPYRTNPCKTAVQSAQAARATGTWVYTIGYSISTSTYCYKSRGSTNSSDREQPLITATQALQQMANPGNYYYRPDSGQLNTIFTAIAADISTGASKLID